MTCISEEEVMGIEYSFINYKSQTLLEMGKGSWHRFEDTLKELILNFENEKLFVLEATNNLLKHFEDSNWGDGDHTIYALHLSKLLYDFTREAVLNDLDWTNDGADDLLDLHSKGYVYVGTRYMDFDERNVLKDKKYREDVDSANNLDHWLAEFGSVEKFRLRKQSVGIIIPRIDAGHYLKLAESTQAFR